MPTVPRTASQEVLSRGNWSLLSTDLGRQMLSRDPRWQLLQRRDVTPERVFWGFFPGHFSVASAQVHAVKSPLYVQAWCLPLHL